MLDYVNILHAGAVGRNQKEIGFVKRKLKQIFGAASSKKVVPYCSTVYFPVVIEILVFKSDIFNYYREVHSNAILMHRRTTFWDAAAPKICFNFRFTKPISFWFRPTAQEFQKFT